MKRRIVFLLAICSLLCAQAQSTCDRAFDKATKLYNNGRYKDAKMQFSWCQSHCKDRSFVIYQGWLDRCDEGVNKMAENTRRRIKAEKEAIARKEAEAVERNKKREQFRYVRITASSPVQGLFENIEYDIQRKIKASAPGLNFTDDTSLAYWEVRVMVNIRTHSIPSNDIQKFSVEAFVEVEEVLTGKVEKFTEWEEGACLSDVTEEQAAKYVADEIYKQNELFCRIADNISNIINRTNESTCPKSNGDSLKDNKRTVLLIHNKANAPENFVDYLYDNMENVLVNDSLNRFQISSRDDDLDILRKKEIRRQEEYYRTDKISQVVVGAGVKYLCGIIISGSGNDLSFKCTVIELETGDMLKDMHVMHSETIKTPDNVSAKNVANSLADQLGLLTEAQKRKIGEDQSEMKSKKKAENKAYMLKSFVPGLTQLQNKRKITGTLFVVGETLCVGGAIAMHGIGINYEDKINKTNNATLKKNYANNANTCYTMRNVMIGAAVAVYIWNVIDAFANKPKDMTYVYPYIGNDNFGLAMNINF